MRILYVTNGFPYPLTSGYLRHYFLIRELSKWHSITLYSLVNHEVSDEHIAALGPYTENVVVFRRGAKGVLGNAVGTSRTLARLSSAVRAMWNAIEETTKSRAFDVAFFSGKFTVPPNSRLGTVPLVADMCDAGSIRIAGRLRLAGLLEKPSILLKYFLTRRLERSVMRRATHSVFVSARDRDALTSSEDPSVTIVPNGVDVDYWQRSSNNKGINTVVFTGAMNYGPNLDAALHLTDDIFPRVRQAIPEAQLFIVGRDPGPNLMSRSSVATGVKVTGFVEDIRPFLERSTVFAAPLRFASGIQNKVLEALAMEMHVVASPAAAGGIRSTDALKFPVQVVEGASAFAVAITGQLEAGIYSPYCNPVAREYVQQHFGWRPAAEKLERILAQVAGQPSAVSMTSLAPVESMLLSRKAC